MRPVLRLNIKRLTSIPTGVISRSNQQFSPPYLIDSVHHGKSQKLIYDNTRWNVTGQQRARWTFNRIDRIFPRLCSEFDPIITRRLNANALSFSLCSVNINRARFTEEKQRVFIEWIERERGRRKYSPRSAILITSVRSSWKISSAANQYRIDVSSVCQISRRVGEKPRQRRSWLAVVSNYLKLKDGRNCICRCRRRLINGREKSTLDTKVEIPSILSLWFVFLRLVVVLLGEVLSFAHREIVRLELLSILPLLLLRSPTRQDTIDVKIKNHSVPFSPTRVLRSTRKKEIKQQMLRHRTARELVIIPE